MLLLNAWSLFDFWNWLHNGAGEKTVDILIRIALEVEALTKGFDEGPLFKNFNLLLEVGEKIAILGLTAWVNPLC